MQLGGNLYDYNNPVFSPETGHFTQNVWRSSTHVGFGFGNAVDQYGKFWASYVVAKFFAPGNVEDEFELNVLPPASVRNAIYPPLLAATISIISRLLQATRINLPLSRCFLNHGLALP